MLVIDVDYIEPDFYCKINAFVRLMQIRGPYGRTDCSGDKQHELCFYNSYSIFQM